MRPSSISSSSFAAPGDEDRREALGFVRRVLVFLAPLLVVGLASQFALWRVGEAWSMRSVLAFEEAQRAVGSETLFARALVSEEMRRYKARHLAARTPQVVVLGSSTTMQIRDFHFGPYAKVFYNAGGLVQHSGDLRAVAGMLDRNGWPAFIALGLDLWWFNGQWTPSRRIASLERIESMSEFDADWAARLQAYPATLSHLSKPGGVALLGELWGPSVPGQKTLATDGAAAIGLAAQSGGGFRGSDGSRRSASFLARVAAGEAYLDNEQTLRRIEQGHKRFEPGSFSFERVAEIREFLVRAKQAGCVVAGFAIPFDSQVRAALRASPGHSALLADYQRETRELFEVARMPFVDAVDHFGLADSWMINGFHGSERSMAHVVRGWLADPAARAALPRLAASSLDCLIAAADARGLVEGSGDCESGVSAPSARAK